MTVVDYAIRLADSNISVGPALVSEKRPVGQWKERQTRAYTEEEIPKAFGTHEGVCIYCGEVSGHLEMIDFDCRAVDYEEWYNRVDNDLPGLVQDLVIERSQSGGRHVVYRARNMEGNQKLCTRIIQCEDHKTHEFRGKHYPVTKLPDGRYVIKPCTIETRGTGGIFLCYPTAGYRLEQGSFTSVKLISDEERDTMIRIAREMSDEAPVIKPPKPEKPAPRTQDAPVGSRPGDIYNRDGDVAGLLTKHGWTMVKGGENQYWRRPGKTSGHSATLKDGCFAVWSSNAEPFEAGKQYAPFITYSILEHGGDQHAAASKLAEDEAFRGCEITGVDLTAILDQVQNPKPITEPEPEASVSVAMPSGYDPSKVVMSDAELDAEMERRLGKREYDWGMFKMPGLVHDMMKCIMDHAVYPNPVIAFTGSIAMLGALAGRKFCDSTDMRTNIYTVCLAESSQGKDASRKFNCKLADEIGVPLLVRRQFASAEGIQDSLIQSPSILYQVDEIQQIFNAMKNKKDAKSAAVMEALMELYSSSSSNFTMRSKAGQDAPAQVEGPCLCLHGSSIPNVFYPSLSSTMVVNGMFARFLVLEAPYQTHGYEPTPLVIPQDIIDRAKALYEYLPAVAGIGNIGRKPDEAETTRGGKRSTVEAMKYSERMAAIARKDANDITGVVWGKATENVRKLALLYAISRDQECPVIDNEAVLFARDIVFHSVHHMQMRAQNYITDSEEERQIIKVRELIKEGGESGILKSDLSRRCRYTKRVLDEILKTLAEQDRIAFAETDNNKGRKGTLYFYRD